MEWKWAEMRPPPLPPPRLEREHPSFSAALLDAIYRSIDSSPDHKQPNKLSKSRPPVSITNALAPPAEFWRDPRAVTIDHRIPSTPKHYPTTPRYRTAITSFTTRQRPNRPNRVQPNPLHQDSSPKEEKSDLVINRDKKKAKKVKKKSIKSLWKFFYFFKRDKNGKLIKAPQQVRESMVKTVCYSSRSCMSNKRKSAELKRSVRFAPMSVILDEESRPCGYKSVHDNGTAEKHVEELLKSLNGEEKKKDKRNESNSSGSVLFELKAAEQPSNHN